MFADASIFPVVPCANTNFPTMMAAEKIADEILRAEVSARPAHQVAAA
jgi:5-(hydroxymethyl)furfural/furfural oxidase